MTDRIRNILGALWLRAYEREDLVSMFLIEDATWMLEFSTPRKARKTWKKVYKLLFVEK